MTKKITIIGGSGFVGTNLCRRLHDTGQSFEIVDLKKSRQFPELTKLADVRDLDSLRNAISGQVVINLAAVHRDDVRDIDEYRLTNVVGAENIIRVCAEKDIRKIIFTSTVAVYGFAEPGTNETGTVKPFNEYGRTKFAAEERFRRWQKSGPHCLLIVRPTVIFGEGNRGNVYNLLRQIASGKFIMVGDGKNKKSMAYVNNVVAFLEQCIATDLSYGLFNYVDGPDMSMNELVGLIRRSLLNKDGVGLRIPYVVGLAFGYTADLMAKIIGRTLPVSAIRVKKFTAFTQFESSRTKLDGFQPPFTLAEGLIRTLENEFLKPDPDQEIFYTE